LEKYIHFVEMADVLEVQLLSDNGTVPQKANPSDAGYDLFSSKGCVLEPWSRCKVDTDIAICVPPGTYGRLAPRSGLAAKNGIHVGAGVVDRQYQGHVGVILFNLSDEPFTVLKGDRIAQLILERITTDVTTQVVPKLTQPSERGTNGFGSSGMTSLIDEKKKNLGTKRKSADNNNNLNDEKDEQCVKRACVRGGRIVVLTGPMFASKTTNLSAYARRYMLAKKKCLVVKYLLDTRYSSESELITHDKIALPASCVTDRLSTLSKSQVMDADVILIDEAHFYDDLVEFCLTMAELGKVVIAAGLASTWDQKPFTNMSTLLSHADETVHLKAVCTLCGEDAIYTKRLSNATDRQIIGGAEAYTARCRTCFKL